MGRCQLVDQRTAGLLVRVERLGLTTGSVEREHEFGARALAQRVPGDEALELSYQLRILAESEIGLDAPFDGGSRSSSSRAISAWANGS